MTMAVPTKLTRKDNIGTVVNRINVINQNMELHGTGVYNTN